MGINKKQANRLWKQLLKISDEVENQNYGIEEIDGEIYQTYSIETESGKNLYEALSDDVFLDYLRYKTEEMGRSPAQKEIFWVIRVYIKTRFHKWPYALKAAGLCKAAGKGGKTLVKIQEEKDDYEKILNIVREKAKELCRIPHQADLPQLDQYVSKYATSWGQIIQEAGIDESFFQTYAVYEIEDKDEELIKDLEYLQELGNNLHRVPLRSEVQDDIKERLVSKCGSYRNALHQIGLEPVKKRNPFLSARTGHMDLENRKAHYINLQNCYYRILNPDPQTEKDLQWLYDYWKENGEIPDRKEVEPELRKRLQVSCGSWANAIYQIHFKEILGEE